MARASRAEWAKRVERWKASELTAKEFCAESGLNPSTLSYWSWKLRSTGEQPRHPKRGKRRARKKPVAEPKGEFIAVATTAVSTSASMLEVVLFGDVRVRVPAGFDEATLTSVVRALTVTR